MAAPVLQFKRGLLANLPGLRAGEPGFTTDSYDLYVGIDSTTTNNKFFGSHRYWTKGTASTGSGVNLVEGTTNGTDYITLKAPDSLSGITTYTFPATATAGYYLKTAADGTLSWAAIAQNSFSGIVTFTDTTDNTLGNADTGSVQIDGGLGINKNLTVGQNLNVQGYSEFIGVVTFRGGTINIGDANTDNINVSGEFISNLTPNADNTYDLGIGTQRWRDANFAGVVTAVSANITNLVPTNINSSGIATLTTLNVTNSRPTNLNVSGIATVSSLTVNGAATFTSTVTGTISTATRATTVDVTAAPSGVYYPTLVNTPSTGTGYSLYSDAGIYYVAQTDTLYLNGNLSIGGTTGVLFATNLFVNDKDIVVGYTTDGSGNDASKDSTSTHGGIAVASTTGSPLFNMPQVAGVNSLPFTYKQFMWVAQNTSGYSGMGTDAWVSNYAVAIGTVTVANNSRFTVGAGFTVYDTYLDANAFDIRVRNINSSGITTLTGALNANGNVTLGDASGDIITVNGTATFGPTITGTISTATRAQNIDVVGVATNQNYYITLVDGSGNQKALGVDAELIYNANTNTFKVGTGVGITQFSSAVGSGTSTSSVPTSSAVIDYVGTQIGNVDLTLGLNADSGGPSTVNTSQTLTISGTTNQVQTAVSGQTVTVSLPSAVVVGTSLSSPTVKVATLQHSNGTQAATIDTSGNITASQNLTISGNLYVNGSTTQVNTTTTTIEDQLLDLGMVDGSVPSSDLNKDIGLLLNYYTTSAKKAAVFWDDSASRIVFADDVTESTGVLTVASNAYASIEIEGLWVNDCAGQSQVINCSGTTRTLENITIDGGSF